MKLKQENNYETLLLDWNKIILAFLKETQKAEIIIPSFPCGKLLLHEMEVMKKFSLSFGPAQTQR